MLQWNQENCGTERRVLDSNYNLIKSNEHKNTESRVCPFQISNKRLMYKLLQLVKQYALYEMSSNVQHIAKV